MKLKQRISRLMISCCMLGCMWLVSLLPAHALDVAALWLFGACFVLLIWWGCFVLKKKCLMLICLLIGFAQVGFAQDAEMCAAAFQASVAEGRWCLFSDMSEKYGGELCQYIQTFNPSAVQNTSSSYDLQVHVNMADRIVQAYTELDDYHQRSASANCQFLTPEDRNASLDTRLKKLRANKGAVCCSWAMQTMNQIYSSQFSERQVQTVPMMLADEKNQCWPCDVIYLLIVLINTLAFRSAPAMAAAGVFFLKWAFIFWLVVKIMMLFLNYGSDKKEYGGTKFLQELFARTLCVLAAALILGSTAVQYDKTILKAPAFLSGSRDKTMLDDVYDTIVNPVFNLVAAAGIDMTQALLEGETTFYGQVAKAVNSRPELHAYGVAMNRVNYCDKVTGEEANSIYQYFVQSEAESVSSPSSYLALNFKAKDDNRFIKKDLTKNILCLTQLSFRGMSPIAAIGSIFVSHAIKNGQLLTPFPGRIPLMPQIFYGLLLNIICWLIGIIIAFRLIDIMLRLSLMVMLAPVFIAVAAFPISRGYAVKGVKFFLSAVMGFVEVAIGVGIVVPFFYKAIAGNQEEELIQAIVAPSGSQYVPNLYAFFSKGSFKLLIYILGVSWLASKLFDGVRTFFKTAFGLSAIGTMGGESTLSATQVSIRSAIGQTYDYTKKVRRSSNAYKNAFASHMGGGVVEKGGAWVGRGLGYLEGHASVAKNRFFNDTRAGRFAVAAKDKTKAAYNAGAKAVSKVGNLMGSGVQKGGKGLMRSGAQVSKAGYGLGAIVGVPMMLAGAAVWTAGTATKFAGKTAAAAVKRLPSYARNQLNKGVHQFFHPPEK